VTLRVTPAELVQRALQSNPGGLVGAAKSWPRVRLGEVARVINGAAYDSKLFNRDGTGLPVIRIRDVGADRPSTWYSGEWNEANLVANGDLLVGMDGDFRLDRWRAEEALLNQRVCKISVDKSRYNERFLELALPGYLELIWEATSSTTVKHLSSRTILDVPLPDPSLEEQQNVVNVVDRYLQHLNFAEGNMAGVEEKIRALKSSALRDLLAEASLSGPSELLGEMAIVQTGSTPARTNSAFYEGGSIPWVTSGDLAPGVIKEARQFVTAAGMASSRLKIFPRGTLLVAMYGEGKTRGTVARLDIDATINQACAAIRLADDDLYPWVKVVLEANYLRLRSMAAGGVQPNLNLSLVRSIPIPLPGSADRDRLLKKFRTIEQSIDFLLPSTRVARFRSNALRRTVIAAGLNGRLTTTATKEAIPA